MTEDAYKKFNNAVVGGIKMFVTLRLRGYPAEDGVNDMIDLWLAVLAPLRQWDDEDIANLQNAFIATARSVEEFPTPKAVIANLEPKVTIGRPALPQPPKTPTEKRAISQIFKDIFNQLSINTED